MVKAPDQILLNYLPLPNRATFASDGSQALPASYLTCTPLLTTCGSLKTSPSLLPQRANLQYSGIAIDLQTTFLPLEECRRPTPLQTTSWTYGGNTMAQHITTYRTILHGDGGKEDCLCLWFTMDGRKNMSAPTLPQWNFARPYSGEERCLLMACPVLGTDDRYRGGGDYKAYPSRRA